MKAQTVMFTFPLVFVAVLFQFLPLLTRKGVFFSATVDPACPQSSDGRRLLRSYRWQVALWSVVAIVLTFWLAPEHPAASMATLCGLIVATGFSYWLKFREVHTHYGVKPTEIRQANLSSQPAAESFNLWLLLPPFLALVATALFLHAHWDQLPLQFPVHWGADGQPNRWANRDWLGVYGPLLWGAAMDLFLLGFAWFLAQQSRKTTMRYVTVRGSQFLLYPMTFAFVMVALLPLVSLPLWLVPAVMMVSIAGVIYWSYRKLTAPSATDEVPDPQSDSHWKAGIFYYNPNDPAIFVSKRVGIGYTMNFANLWSWVVLGFTVLAIAASVYFRHPTP